MFNLMALIGLIDKNNDQQISKEEIQEFQGKLNKPSVFCEYMETVNSDCDVSIFAKQLQNIYKQNNGNMNLQFSTQEYADEYSYKVDSNINQMLEYIRQSGLLGKEAQFNELVAKYNEEFGGDRQKVAEKICILAQEQVASNSIQSQAVPYSPKDDLKECLAWRVGGVDKFNEYYDKFNKEFNGDIDKIANALFSLPSVFPLTIENFKASGAHSMNLPYETLSGDIDWSASRDVLKYLSFNDMTFKDTPSEHLPEGYDPKVVMENGKTIGLGISNIHSQGYDGSGVSYAIIDSGIPKHDDLRFKEYRLSPLSQARNEHFHGGAVSYIAQEIAPNSDCYYYAQQNGSGMEAPVLDNLKAILAKNEELKSQGKPIIRIVSMSMPLYGGKESQEVVKQLEAQGCWVLYSGSAEDGKFAYTNKIDPMGDPDDFNNLEAAFYDEKRNQNTLYVNSGNRTVPDPASPNAYRHDSRASQSWSIPVIAGYYTLACQADPSMTKERFMQLAEKTARTVMTTKPELEQIGRDSMFETGRSQKTYPMKVIDIEALIAEIEAQKK